MHDSDPSPGIGEPAQRVVAPRWWGRRRGPRPRSTRRRPHSATTYPIAGGSGGGDGGTGTAPTWRPSAGRRTRWRRQPDRRDQPAGAAYQAPAASTSSSSTRPRSRSPSPTSGASRSPSTARRGDRRQRPRDQRQHERHHHPGVAEPGTVWARRRRDLLRDNAIISHRDAVRRWHWRRHRHHPAHPSGLPYINGVFDNTNASTAKVDFRGDVDTIDVVDAPPDCRPARRHWQGLVVRRARRPRLGTMQVSALPGRHLDHGGARRGACATSMVAGGIHQGLPPSRSMNLSGKLDFLAPTPTSRRGRPVSPR